jgi:hypothetical protein
MPGVHCGERPLSARELAPSPRRLTGLASSRPYQVVVLWRSRRGRLCGLCAPDDTEDLRSSERSYVGEWADPSIACVDGGLVLERTLAVPAFIAWSLRCRPADVEANPSSSIGSRHYNRSRLDFSAKAQRGRRIESSLENCPENTFIA